MSTLNEAVRDLRGLIYPVEGEDEFICESATTLIDLIPEDAVIVVVRREDIYNSEIGSGLTSRAHVRISHEAMDALGVKS